MRTKLRRHPTRYEKAQRPFVLLVSVLLLTAVQCRLLSTAGESPRPVATQIVAAATDAQDVTEIGSTTVTTVIPTATATAPLLPTASATPVPSTTPTSSPSPRPTTTPTPTGTPLPHPLYCAEPPEDYTRVNVGQHTLNARTLAMLEAAQQIYAGPGDIMRITQGSYRDVLEASFGTHAGGGAVDISIRDPRNESVFLWDEADAMVQALRYAGFAAWFRDVGDLGQNSPAHIHAIAVGDAELSPAAQEQVSGEGGYFAGMDGLIAPYGPNVDRHGGPVICGWMETGLTKGILNRGKRGSAGDFHDEKC